MPSNGTHATPGRISLWHCGLHGLRKQIVDGRSKWRGRWRAVIFSAEVRKLVGLVQLKHVAEGIMEEGLVAGAGDERDPVHLDALLLQVAHRRVDVIDADGEVVCA
jgi:hypothetical protein